MNKHNENREQFFLNAFLMGLLLFVFIAFSSNSSSNSQNYDINSIGISEIYNTGIKAVLTSPPDFPEFNSLWITSNIDLLKYKSNNNFSVFISNLKTNSDYNSQYETYLRIKPQTFNVSSSFLYSSNNYEEYPAIS